MTGIASPDVSARRAPAVSTGKLVGGIVAVTPEQESRLSSVLERYLGAGTLTNWDERESVKARTPASEKLRLERETKSVLGITDPAVKVSLHPERVLDGVSQVEIRISRTTPDTRVTDKLVYAGDPPRFAVSSDVAPRSPREGIVKEQVKGIIEQYKDSLANWSNASATEKYVVAERLRYALGLPDSKWLDVDVQPRGNSRDVDIKLSSGKTLLADLSLEFSFFGGSTTTFYQVPGSKAGVNLSQSSNFRISTTDHRGFVVRLDGVTAETALDYGVDIQNTTTAGFLFTDKNGKNYSLPSAAESYTVKLARYGDTLQMEYFTLSDTPPHPAQRQGVLRIRPDRSVEMATGIFSRRS